MAPRILHLTTSIQDYFEDAPLDIFFYGWFSVGDCQLVVPVSANMPTVIDTKIENELALVLSLQHVMGHLCAMQQSTMIMIMESEYGDHRPWGAVVSRQYLGLSHNNQQ